MPGNYARTIKSLPFFDGRFDACRLAADACDLLFASCPAATRFEAHRHDTGNYGKITRGELILTMDGVTRRFACGDRYRVPANTEHAAAFEVETDEIEFWFRS